jgi:hypothetical protein
MLGISNNYTLAIQLGNFNFYDKHVGTGPAAIKVDEFLLVRTSAR